MREDRRGGRALWVGSELTATSSTPSEPNLSLGEAEGDWSEGTEEWQSPSDADSDMIAKALGNG